MNDTHSLYYNVDHSSMFGSNLSTVFADGPPPLEDGDDDHGEFVFSSETDAIGEAVLSKIESKLQRDAQGRPVGDISSSNSSVEIKPNSSAEKFEAFANFEAANQIDTSRKQDSSAGVSPEINGHKGSLKNNALSSDDFSDDEFGDFSTSFNQSSNFNENGKSDVHKPDSNFGDFSAFNDEQVSFNGEGDINTKAGTNSNDSQFADFSSFDGVDYETNDDGVKSNDDTVDEQQSGKECNQGKIEIETENNAASDDEFASFTEANAGDFATFKTTDNGGNLTNPNPDIIPANERNDVTSSKLPPDLTNHERKHNDDEFNSSEAFKDDLPSNNSADLTSAKLPPDLTTHETKCDDFDSFEAFEDDSFNDFPSSSDNDFGDFSQGFPNSENQTRTKSQSDESQASNTDVSKPDTNCKTEGHVVASPENDDFGDFADFSNDSFNAEKKSDGAFGSFSQQNEESSADQWGEAKFEAFAKNDKTDKSKETKVLSRNNSNFSRQDSGDFTASKNEPEFQADFGAFTESNNSKNQEKFQADFGAFSESTSSENKPSDFGAFSGNTSSKNKPGFQVDFAFSQNTMLQKSFNQSSSNKQMGTQTQLVSLHACFQDVFVTSQHKVEDLQRVKVPGQKRYLIIFT